MSGRKKFEMAIQQVKASFFDTLYRKQRLVHVLTEELSNYSETEQAELKKCFVEQADLAADLVARLEDVDVISVKLAKVSDKIGAIIGSEKMEMVTTKESGMAVGQNVQNSVEVSDTSVKTVEVTPEAETVKADVPVEEADNVSTVNAAAKDSDGFQFIPSSKPAGATNETEAVKTDIPVEATGEAEAVKADVPVDGTPSVEATTAAAEDTDDFQFIPSSKPVESTNEAEAVKADVPAGGTTSVTATTTGTQATTTTTSNSVSEKESNVTLPELNIPGSETKTIPTDEVKTPVEAPAVPEIPVTVVPAGNVPPATTGDASQVTGETVATDTKDSATEAVPFALSPMDEGVTPKENVEQTSAPETAGVETTDNSDVLKVVKSDANSPKAILVTAVQLSKLMASRDTQKALMSAKGAFGTGTTITPIATSGAVDEQTLMANGLLAPTADATKKQMEGIMEQANALYKEGKTAEAQALYDQVSTMNQTMQATTTGEQAKVLVNTPAAAPTIVA